MPKKYKSLGRHRASTWQVRAYDEDMRVVEAAFTTLREAKAFVKSFGYPYPMQWRDVYKYRRRVGLDLIDRVNNVWASIRFFAVADMHALPVAGLRGFGAGEETVDSIYLGNFGDVNPLEYHGFFVWWRPEPGTSRKKAMRLAKGHKFKDGDLFAIMVNNWCDATGECENEERVLAEEVHYDVKGLLSGDGWIDWKRVADSVGRTPKEVKEDPVWALHDAIGYYGAHEFHPGGFQPLYAAGGSFVESFRRMALDLLNLGVPRDEIEFYLEG